MTLAWSPKDKQLESPPQRLDDSEEGNAMGNSTYTWWDMGVFSAVWLRSGGLDRHRHCPLAPVIPSRASITRTLLQANYKTPRSLVE